MNSLRKSIQSKLEQMSERELEIILEFVNFITWKKQNQVQSSNSIETKTEDCLVENVGGVLVVKATSNQAKSLTSWETAIEDLREERLLGFSPLY